MHYIQWYETGDNIVLLGGMHTGNLTLDHSIKPTNQVEPTHLVFK